MKLISSLLSGAALTITLALAAPVLANECPRGDLDKRYCDVNGDLIADTPTDASELVDPDTLIFAYTPVEDPAVYKKLNMEELIRDSNFFKNDIFKKDSINFILDKNKHMGLRWSAFCLIRTFNKLNSGTL